MNKIVIFSTIFFMCISGCNKPTAKITEISVQNSNPSNVILKCKVQINNPYPAPISITRFNYKLTVEGKEFLSGNIPNGKKIPANLYKQVDLQFIVKLENLFAVAADLQQGDIVKYLAQVKAILYAPTYGSVTVPIQKQGQFELSTGGIQKFIEETKNITEEEEDIIAGDEDFIAGDEDFIEEEKKEEDEIITGDEDFTEEDFTEEDFIERDEDFTEEDDEDVIE